MLTGTLIALTLLGAPKDAAAMLRTAWASQYEWKESGVENAVLEFTYAHHWQDHKTDYESRFEAQAQVVVVGNEIVRRHYPGVSDSRRQQIEPHLAWVLERFVRKPFEKEFEEMTFGGPEPTEGGLLRISVAPESDPEAKRYFLLKNDRIVGTETRSGRRVLYTVESMEDGYAILGDEMAWTDKGEPGSMTHRLELEKDKDRPLPKSYTYRLATARGTADERLDFAAARLNVKHPVVGDPAARDAAKEAWPRRYVLPNDIRIEAEFHRRIDKDLEQLYWWNTVKGDLQVWGMDTVNMALDKRLFQNRTYAPELRTSCQGHFRWFFGWLHDRPFEKAFEGCGFEFIESGDESVAMLVFGHPSILGLLVREGRIVGYRGRTGDEEIWWRFKLKKARIECMSAKLGKESYKLHFKYMRRKGIDVPKSFEVFGGPRPGSKREGHGIAEYSLKKVKVSFPR
ncbi:MAG: hypothetical protein ACYTDU_06515 [Planctomycetota bacterium]|jgi:hypothetical protein